MFFFFGGLSSSRRPLTPLAFYNTLSGKVESFTGPEDGMVRMYNCGPTVYDYQHIGNLRPYVFADVLRRTMLLNGYEVDQVINITDVGHLVSDADSGEDKLEKSARATGESIIDIVKRVTDAYFKDLELLNVEIRETRFPKATEYIQEQIALVKSLEEKGYTYTISDGVYFDTSKFPRYGALGNINIDELREGARIEENADKRNPTDFALWKLSSKNEKRLQEWESPWGVGFPGWHIECSAMAMKLLGKQIDIHTGGIDHIPVHHNNEIAQSECATGKVPFSRFWLHSAFITIEGKKISKSIGSTIFLRNLIDRNIAPLAYRYWLLGAQYRAPMNFTWDAVEGAHNALSRLQRIFVDEFRRAPVEKSSTKYVDEFNAAMNSDLDTPRALAILWELVKDQAITSGKKRATLLHFDSILALGLRHLSEIPDHALSVRVIPVDELPDDIKTMIVAREHARAEDNWLDADRIRADLLQMGYSVEDTPEGPRVEKKQKH